MAKKKISLFECQHCGEQSTKWLGKCPNCGSWDSFIELNQEQQEVLKHSSKIINTTSKAVPITQIQQDNVTRFSSFNDEFDYINFNEKIDCELNGLEMIKSLKNILIPNK